MAQTAEQQTKRLMDYFPVQIKVSGQKIIFCGGQDEVLAVTDGRGFSLARLIRSSGFTGRLRAVGLLLPHQFRHLIQTGFDEYMATEKTAVRFPEWLWQEQIDALPFSYQDRLSGSSALNEEKPPISQKQSRDSRINGGHDGSLGG